MASLHFPPSCNVSVFITGRTFKHLKFFLLDAVLLFDGVEAECLEVNFSNFISHISLDLHNCEAVRCESGPATVVNEQRTTERSLYLNISFFPFCIYFFSATRLQNPDRLQQAHHRRIVTETPQCQQLFKEIAFNSYRYMYALIILTILTITTNSDKECTWHYFNFVSMRLRICAICETCSHEFLTLQIPVECEVRSLRSRLINFVSKVPFVSIN